MTSRPAQPSEANVTAPIRLPPALTLLRVFHHRNYRLYFTGQIVSLLGTWMQKVAQAWLVYRLTNSPMLLGLTTFCATASIFFIAPFGGMIADRVNRRKMLLFTQTAAMLQAMILAALTLSGLVQVWEVIALAFLLGLVDSFDVPTRHALLLDLVGPADLRPAIALNSIMFNLARIVGPSLAAGTIAVLGEGTCFLFNAASFAAVLFNLYRMEIPERAARIVGHPIREILDGYRYSLSRPLIRSSLLLVAISSLFGAAYVSLMPAVARDLLHGSAGSYGLLMASGGAGALAGAYLLSRFSESWLIFTPAAAALFFGAGLVALSSSHILWLSLVVMAPTASLLMLLGGATNTVVQLTAEQDFRGRAISHYTQCFLGMTPWGALMFGALATRIGVSHTLAIGGGVVAAAGFIVFVLRRAEYPFGTTLEDARLV